MDASLAKGPKPDVRDACRWTPLMKAALNGHRDAVQTVRALLRHGADPTLLDFSGRTASDWAVGEGHTEVSALLGMRPGKSDKLFAGPDSRNRNKRGCV